MSEPCYSVGSTSKRQSADPDVIGTWQIIFLPKGYGPTLEDRVVYESPISRTNDWEFSVLNPPGRVKRKLKELKATLAR